MSNGESRLRFVVIMTIAIGLVGRGAAGAVRSHAFALAQAEQAGSARLEDAEPASVGMDAARLDRVRMAVDRAVLVDRSLRGAVVVVARRGKIVLRHAVGERSVEPQSEPMTVDTIFDLASLTKPVATATALMVLVERGRVRLDAPLRTYLSGFDKNGKGAITIEQLLRHRSGLIADNALEDYQHGVDTAWERLANLGLVHPPGARFLYSDVNYMVLGRVIERVGGTSLDAFTRTEVFEPLGMSDTRFWPTSVQMPAHVAARVAPTEPDEGGRMLRGVVHDPRARALGGVAGHAGLFGTADDLAVYAQALLDGGLGRGGRRVLSPLGVRLMTGPGTTPPGQRRGLGWDLETPYSAPRGALFGVSSFGHTGFTGTSIWIDPETETVVILLSSRLHPDGKGHSPIALRHEVGTLAAAALVDRTEPRDNATTGAGHEVRIASEARAVGSVRCGIDVLAARGFDLLKGKRVGLVTNHTGRAESGESTIDVLRAAEGVELRALFSPEHGVRGELDREVDDSRDERTGLPIHSLYGKTRKPTAEQLSELDVLVYDIQDIGTRFYTYISTLGLCLEAAKERGLPLVVLDRPNPLGGARCDGPVRGDGFESFIAFHALPLIHGMTVGELARLFNAERGIAAELVVVPCEGWSRDMLFDETGLVWVNPSPNMRSLTEALLYPGVGMLEATNLATGRGTDTPFERVGAPWINPVAFARALHDERIPGVRFVPIRFRPSERQYAGEECGGVFIQIVDRASFDPMALGFGMARVLRTLYADQWNADGLRNFVADEATLARVAAKRPVEEIRAGWVEGLERFGQRRAKYLLYE